MFDRLEALDYLSEVRSSRLEMGIPNPTLAEIKAIPIMGNFFSDSPIFEAVDAFLVVRGNPIGEKLEALDYLHREVMGLNEEPADQVLLNETIDLIKQARPEWFTP